MDEPTSITNGAEDVVTTDSRARIQELEMENKRIHDEFNVQRAKMKELFMLKEREYHTEKEQNEKLLSAIKKINLELDDAKSQLLAAGLTFETNIETEKRKAEEEIATLQKLVHETLEESSSSKTIQNTEIERLQLIIQELQLEITELRKYQISPHHAVAQEQQHSLAPGNVLNALTKGIAKKLGADSFSSQDSLDDNLKKYEDLEVLRSLVEPLEDQITALKEKLRNTDEQLQKCKECRHVEDTPQMEQQLKCDMCQNYEAQLVNEQKKCEELTAKIITAEKAAERHKEELIKEIGFRKEMEEKWNEKKEELKRQVSELTQSTECSEQDLKELRDIFKQSCSEFRAKLNELTEDRERTYEEIQKLQFENDNLVGKYTMHSQELQSQSINLPNNVEELHELILKNNQDLIIAKIGKENAEANMNTLQTNIALLKDQITNEQHEKKVVEENLVQKIHIIIDQKRQLEKELKNYNANKEKLGEFQEQINELLTSKKQLVELNNELKTKISALQQELDTSEAVQKDFVQLSQNLQVQLEKIRASDSQVRWQYEDDIDSCPTCHSGFSNSKRKQHCRHCGQIFCQHCLTRVVRSGPNMRESKVCDVCHTLLVQSSAPYFSELPPPT